MEEEPNESQNAILLENEDLKHQLHQLRLKNAEHRGEINRYKRENGELAQANALMDEKCR